MESIRQSHFRALTSAAVALETITDVLAIHRDCGTVALIEHRRDQHGIAMPIEGPDPGPDHLIMLDDLLLRAVGDDPGARLVFASVRMLGADGGVVAEADIETWRRLVANHENHACDLVDWFLVDPVEGEARSLAETAGPQPDWAAA
ncbi:MAG TPA: hypothetical protein VI916_06005 [Acidimicrobiia bacterium]|nr:hypothetical protein [Acidimicrobiia bacterium]